MRLLIADDDAVMRLALEAMLRKRGHAPVVACDGAEAWQRLQEDPALQLAILDWMMPGLDGIEVCRRARAELKDRKLYLILLTSQDSKANVIEGLQAGASDYVTKPFDNDELHARISVGAEVVRLWSELENRVRELEAALARERRLEGLLPICSYCKKIRDDRAYWHEVEHFISEHSGALFSHGICPACYAQIVEPELRQLEQRK